MTPAGGREAKIALNPLVLLRRQWRCAHTSLLLATPLLLAGHLLLLAGHLLLLLLLLAPPLSVEVFPLLLLTFHGLRTSRLEDTILSSLLLELLLSLIASWSRTVYTRTLCIRGRAAGVTRHIRRL